MSWSTRIDECAELLGDSLDHAAQVLGLLVGQACGRLVQQHDLGRADDGARDLDEPAVARAEAADLGVRGDLEADVVDRARTSARRDARPAPECSWIMAMLSNTDSCSIAISVWNVRRRPQRARR